jgi:hypothetical protein
MLPHDGLVPELDTQGCGGYRYHAPGTPLLVSRERKYFVICSLKRSVHGGYQYSEYTWKASSRGTGDVLQGH